VQNAIVVSDTPVAGGIMLKTSSGAMIVDERRGNHDLERQGRGDQYDAGGVVDINNTALTVTP